MYQLIQTILKNPADKTKIVLLYGSVNEEDILLRKEIDAYAKKNPDQLKVVYLLDNPSSPKWAGEKGFITADLIKKSLPAPSVGDKLRVYVCGPPPMYKVFIYFYIDYLIFI